MYDSERRTETIIQTAQHVFLTLSDDDLNYKPSPERWSVAECLWHLNEYGRYYIPAIEKNIKASSYKPEETFVSGWLGNFCGKCYVAEV